MGFNQGGGGHLLAGGKSNSNSCKKQRMGGKRGGRKASSLNFYGKRGICGSHFFMLLLATIVTWLLNIFFKSF